MFIVISEKQCELRRSGIKVRNQMPLLRSSSTLSIRYYKHLAPPEPQRCEAAQAGEYQCNGVPRNPSKLKLELHAQHSALSTQHSAPSTQHPALSTLLIRTLVLR
jgi:hypothetical protein